MEKQAFYKRFNGSLRVKKALLGLEKKETKERRQKVLKDGIIKNIRNLFQLEKENKPKIKKETKDDIIRSIRNLFKLEQETKPIKDKIISDIKNLFEQEECY